MTEEQAMETVTTNESKDEERMLDAKAIARIWGVSIQRAYSLMSSGELPVVRIGRSVRVPESRLRRWIDEQVSVKK